MKYGKMTDAYMAAEKSVKKLSSKQSKIAEKAEPKNKITGADFKAMKKKGK
jgi:hypothetical protein